MLQKKPSSASGDSLDVQRGAGARGVEDPLERYVTAAMEIAQRDALAAVRGLREPRAPSDPDAALRIVERLVETLTGFAVGAVILPMAQRLRQAGGAEVRDAVQQALRALSSPGAPALLLVRAPALQGPHFLDDWEARPLVDELGSQLCARMAMARGDARALLRQLVSAVERASAASAPAIAAAIQAAFGEAAWMAERLTPVVAEAWNHALAVMRGQPLLSGGWATWSRRAAGLPEPRPELTASDVVAAGYVMRIG